MFSRTFDIIAAYHKFVPFARRALTGMTAASININEPLQ